MTTTEPLDHGKLGELVTLFSDAEMTHALQEIDDEVTADLARISRAAADGDCKAAQTAAHRIRNSAELVGANRLADAARAIEQLALAGDKAALGPALGQLRRSWSAARPMLSPDSAA